MSHLVSQSNIWSNYSYFYSWSAIFVFPIIIIYLFRCLCFIRPNQENLEQLSKELRSPRYGSYHIVFSNIVQKRDLKTLAESDEKESVREVFTYARFLQL